MDRIYVHPGDGHSPDYAVSRWVAGQAAAGKSLRVRASFDNGDGRVFMSVFKDGQLLTTLQQENQDWTSGTIAVSIGTTIDFVVDPAGTWNCDVTQALQKLELFV
jgi:hypothetical protein